LDDEEDPLAKTTRIDSVTFTGRSGRRYEFRIYVWDTRFKPVPAVYVVASRTIEPGQPPRYEAIFVGDTPDLSPALTDHPRNDCFQMHYGNVVGVLKVPTANERASIVADLVGGLAPLCNAPDAE
jgi:hypothetical protein